MPCRARSHQLAARLSHVDGVGRHLRRPLQLAAVLDEAALRRRDPREHVRLEQLQRVQVARVARVKAQALRLQVPAGGKSM